MVKVILMDMEFEKIIDEIDMAIVNTTAAREHVTDCERGIRTIKESARCTVSEMRRVNIKVLPKQVIYTPYLFRGNVDKWRPKREWNQSSLFTDRNSDWKNARIQATL